MALGDVCSETGVMNTVITAMERRKFVIGLGSLAAGGAAAAGTGAFDSVEAERDVDINVEGDAAAYLGIEAHDTFVGDDSEDSELVINLGGPEADGGGDGFNQDAITEISGVITLTNQSSSDNTIDVGLDQSDLQDGIEFSFGDGDEDNLDPGNTVDLDVTVDDLNEDVQDGQSDTLTIEADSV